MNRSSTVQAPSQALVSRGAIFDDGTQIPLQFGDPTHELSAFSSSAALIPGPSSSVLIHEGTDALDLLHRLSTNDMLQLEPGRSASTILTSERGRIIDLLNVCHVESGKLLLLSDSESVQATADWIDRFTIIEDAAVRDFSAEMVRFALIGPESFAVIEAAFGATLTPGDVESTRTGPEETLVVASTWGGLNRVDVVVPTEQAEKTWDSLAGAEAIPAGALAYHAKRVSLAVPYPGAELTADANPLEAGLKSLISFTKGCYVGQEVVARLDTYDKVQRRLVSLSSDRKLTAGAELMSDGKRAGVVTSVPPLHVFGTQSAMGYVRRGFWEAGTILQCGEATVTVQELPGTSTAV